MSGPKDADPPAAAVDVDAEDIAIDDRSHVSSHSPADSCLSRGALLEDLVDELLANRQVLVAVDWRRQQRPWRQPRRRRHAICPSVVTHRALAGTECAGERCEGPDSALPHASPHASPRRFHRIESRRLRRPCRSGVPFVRPGVDHLTDAWIDERLACEHEAPGNPRDPGLRDGPDNGRLPLRTRVRMAL